MSVFIIAELGINHNGDISLAKELIDIAAEAGCNAVKFQKRDIDLVYTKDYLESFRDSPWGTTQREQKNGLEFGFNEYSEIDNYCKKKGIDWFASAWDLKSQKFLRQFKCKFNKIASAMIVYRDLLEEVAKEGKHTFISTGMSTYKDIDLAVNIFKQHNCSFELMHTVSTYPMKVEDANLNLIKSLQNNYKSNVGYSGHEQNLELSFAAVSLGISSLERHLTLNRKMYGSDQSASLEPNEIKDLVKGVRNIEKSLGDGSKKVLDEEKVIANKLRQHINDLIKKTK